MDDTRAGSGAIGPRVIFWLGALLFAVGVAAATLGLLASSAADDDRSEAETQLEDQQVDTTMAEEAIAEAEARRSGAKKARNRVTRAGRKALGRLESFLALQRAQADNIRDIAALNAAGSFSEALRLSEESTDRVDQMLDAFDATSTAVTGVSGAANG